MVRRAPSWATPLTAAAIAVGCALATGAWPTAPPGGLRAPAARAAARGGGARAAWTPQDAELLGRW